MMSYIIQPLELISFVEDSNMKLPRFQRKATWDKKQNFELCISVFQDYPVGVVIVNKEQNVSWLLDGRQRRNALKIMRENPVEVYEWARSYIGFKKNEDEGEIIRLYWEKVEKYLQKEDKSEDETDVDDASYEENGDEDIAESSFDSERQKLGLKNLLDLVLMIHQIKNNVSRWERTFDFKNYCSNLKYELKRESYKINPVILRKYLVDYGQTEKNLSIDSFAIYVDDNSSIVSGKEDKFKEYITKNWDYIKKSIETLLYAEKVYKEARIGIIELTNVSPLDAQNIFSRINRGGTQLKAEELLSAKPFWNENVSEVDSKTKQLVKDLYIQLGVEEPNGVVKWDLAATMISRVDPKCMIFDSTVNDTISMDKVTLGFKLLSSVFVEGMSAISVAELEKKKTIDWDNDIDELVNKINTICDILINDNFFKYFQSWRKPISKLMGNAISLEFISILLKDWEEKECPTVSGAQYKAFQRDARILFDRLVFEYATKVWRGSGDSKMAADIKDWKNRIVSIATAEWDKFIEGALGGTYNGQPVTQKTLTPILYYYYSLKNISATSGPDIQIEVDHIIPKEKFKGNGTVDVQMQDSLGNLALLVKNDNAAKGSKPLDEITDVWLKNQIVMLEEIDESDFRKYSDITNINVLKTYRGKLFKTAFSDTRDTVLSN